MTSHNNVSRDRIGDVGVVMCYARVRSEIGIDVTNIIMEAFFEAVAERVSFPIDQVFNCMCRVVSFIIFCIIIGSLHLSAVLVLPVGVDSTTWSPPPFCGRQCASCILRLFRSTVWIHVLWMVRDIQREA